MAHPDLVAEEHRLRAVAGLLGALESARPAPTLRARVLDEAFRRRPPAPAAPSRSASLDEGTVVGLYREVVTDVTALLDGLAAGDWVTPTQAEGWDVLGVVGHLCGVEELMRVRLDDVADWAPEAFLAASSAGVERAQADGPAATADRWRTLSTAVLAHPAMAPGAVGRGPASLWDGDDATATASRSSCGPSRSGTTARTCAAPVGRPTAVPGPHHYHLMAELGVRALPLMMAARGLTHPGRSARVVLTGPGGGDWLIPLAPGETPSVPAVTLTMDVVEFCFRVADRRRPDELSTRVAVVDDTDPDEADRLIADLLESASALARP